MVDRITKYIKSLPPHEAEAVQHLMKRIKQGDLVGIDIKRLRGHQNIYRARKGKTRILFEELNGQYQLIDVARRSEKTYRNY